MQRTEKFKQAGTVRVLIKITVYLRGLLDYARKYFRAFQSGPEAQSPHIRARKRDNGSFVCSTESGRCVEQDKVVTWHELFLDRSDTLAVQLTIDLNKLCRRHAHTLAAKMKRMPNANEFSSVRSQLLYILYYKSTFVPTEFFVLAMQSSRKLTTTGLMKTPPHMVHISSLSTLSGSSKRSNSKPISKLASRAF